MRILWITNTIFPAPSKILGIPEPVFGGWMYGLLKQLSSDKKIVIGVATVYNGNELKKIIIDDNVYYLLPAKTTISYQRKLEKYWLKVCDDFKPNIIHIHGTEYTHGLSCMRILPEHKYVVSIQGLVSVYSRYYYGGIGMWDIFKNITLRDIILRKTIYHGKLSFEKRGKFEIECIKRAEHVIGRTSWDFAHSRNINIKVKYHHCNEILRDGFYNAKKWNINKKEDFTVFLSQSVYPIKGLHKVIEAISLLKSEFPKIKVKVAGKNILKEKKCLMTLRQNGYEKYIYRLIKKLKLHDYFYFLGVLSEEQMIIEYQKAHVFICPSSIENSPNSVGEAQLLGVPTIASYVGGIPDMIVHGKSGLLYRFDDVEMLAENIKKVFTDNSLALSLSSNGIEVASIRHDRYVNKEKMDEIYKCI